MSAKLENENDELLEIINLANKIKSGMEITNKNLIASNSISKTTEMKVLELEDKVLEINQLIVETQNQLQKCVDIFEDKFSVTEENLKASKLLIETQNQIQNQIQKDIDILNKRFISLEKNLKTAFQSLNNTNLSKFDEVTKETRELTKETTQIRKEAKQTKAEIAEITKSNKEIKEEITEIKNSIVKTCYLKLGKVRNVNLIYILLVISALAFVLLLLK